jgi:UDPglucose 6-dehydrogenase
MQLHGASPEDLSIASNPEFLREGTAVLDFLYPDRILLGVPDERSRRALSQIYEPLLDGSYYRTAGALRGEKQSLPSLIVTSVKSAELIKHASNAFLALKISFINSVAIVCEKVGADVREVAMGMGTDSRIGSKFLNPGIGYGGSCFPKDVLAFRSVAQKAGYDFTLLTEVMAVNEDQKRRFVTKVRDTLWTLRGKRLAALGLAFKGGTDDCRESPAIDLVKQLHAEGAEIVAYDPAAMERAQELLTLGTVTYAQNPYDACAGADAMLILAEWPEFLTLDLCQIRAVMNLPIVLDGKNLLDPVKVTAAGLQYYSVGCCPGAGLPPMRTEDPTWRATISEPTLDGVDNGSVSVSESIFEAVN